MCHEYVSVSVSVCCKCVCVLCVNVKRVNCAANGNLKPNQCQVVIQRVFIIFDVLL